MNNLIGTALRALIEPCMSCSLIVHYVSDFMVHFYKRINDDDDDDELMMMMTN